MGVLFRFVMKFGLSLIGLNALSAIGTRFLVFLEVAIINIRSARVKVGNLTIKIQLSTFRY